MSREDECPACGGTLTDREVRAGCRTCGGTGRVPVRDLDFLRRVIHGQDRGQDCVCVPAEHSYNGKDIKCAMHADIDRADEILARLDGEEATSAMIDAALRKASEATNLAGQSMALIRTFREADQGKYVQGIRDQVELIVNAALAAR